LAITAARALVGEVGEEIGNANQENEIERNLGGRLTLPH
jgi:hypothetical protein